MLDLAIQTEGVIVTNDNYQDLYGEKSQYRFVIENRLAMTSLFIFSNVYVMYCLLQLCIFWLGNCHSVN